MTDRPELAYGSWPSPISIEMAVASALSLREVRLGRTDVYWTEGRPDEGGRQVIVRWNEIDGAVDVTPAPFNARTTAHEYGGGWYAVDRGTVFFSNLEDGRIYRQESDAAPVPLTEVGPFRYGDLVVDWAHDRVLCVREDHTGLEPGRHAPEGERISEPRDALVAVDVTSGAVTVLAEGYDFYSTPRPLWDGERLAWLSWRHPNMPWDSSELWVADVDTSGRLVDPRMIAGGGDESVVQPEWAPDGSLVFASDRTGWWNLYRLTVATSDNADERSVTALAPMEAEFSGPLWVFGMRWFGIASDGTIVATAHADGRDYLWMIPAEGEPERIDVPDAQIDSLVVGGRRVAYIGSSPNRAALGGAA